MSPATGQRPPATGHRHWPPATGHRPPATGQRPPANGHRPPATGHRATGQWPPANSHRPPANGHRPPPLATGHGHRRSMPATVTATVTGHLPTVIGFASHACHRGTPAPAIHSPAFIYNTGHLRQRRHRMVIHMAIRRYDMSSIRMHVLQSLAGAH